MTIENQKKLKRAEAIIEAYEYWEKDQENLYKEIETLKKTIKEFEFIKQLKILKIIGELFNEKNNIRNLR